MNIKIRKISNVNEIKNYVVVETFSLDFNFFRKALLFSKCFFEKTFTGPLVI